MITIFNSNNLPQAHAATFTVDKHLAVYLANDDIAYTLLGEYMWATPINIRSAEFDARDALLEDMSNWGLCVVSPCGDIEATNYGERIMDWAKRIRAARPHHTHKNNYSQQMVNSMIDIDCNHMVRTTLTAGQVQAFSNGFIALDADGCMVLTDSGNKFMCDRRVPNMTVKQANFADELAALLAKYDASIKSPSWLDVNVGGNIMSLKVDKRSDEYTISAKNLRKCIKYSRIV